jgi:hypothetical protein
LVKNATSGGTVICFQSSGYSKDKPAELNLRYLVLPPKILGCSAVSREPNNKHDTMTARRVVNI